MIKLYFFIAKLVYYIKTNKINIIKIEKMIIIKDKIFINLYKKKIIILKIKYN